jgi:hypothetical protein
MPEILGKLQIVGKVAKACPDKDQSIYIKPKRNLRLGWAKKKPEIWAEIWAGEGPFSKSDDICRVGLVVMLYHKY